MAIAPYPYWKKMGTVSSYKIIDHRYSGESPLAEFLVVTMDTYNNQLSAEWQSFHLPPKQAVSYYLSNALRNKEQFIVQQTGLVETYKDRSQIQSDISKLTEDINANLRKQVTHLKELLVDVQNENDELRELVFGCEEESNDVDLSEKNE